MALLAFPSIRTFDFCIGTSSCCIFFGKSPCPQGDSLHIIESSLPRKYHLGITLPIARALPKVLVPMFADNLIWLEE